MSYILRGLLWPMDNDGPTGCLPNPSESAVAADFALPCPVTMTGFDSVLDVSKWIPGSRSFYWQAEKLNK